MWWENKLFFESMTPNKTSWAHMLPRICGHILKDYKNIQQNVSSRVSEDVYYCRCGFLRFPRVICDILHNQEKQKK